ncbi:MAG: N-acetylmuramic acid 6-phosphate etherase [Hespellia sp.]|jgi:N-acetylmuramic acid 6-phosphate etherase|nr:N-acetylmuramic acid 6-phosphate etherase [Hespellia sp.]
MKDKLLSLSTEVRNQASMNLPHMTVAEATALMNREDENCADAVKEVLPVVNQVIEEVKEKIQNGGRLIFIGAAHSGFLGSLDAMETAATYTFGTGIELIPIVAGDPGDIMKTDGSAEDSEENGPIDLQKHNVNTKDFVIGLSASGRTPYVIGALKWCKENGIRCAGLVNNKGAALAPYCDYLMDPTPGPEVVSGSTRLKAGTCQKMVLNIITTVVMAQLGHVYQNLMINVPPVSDKMRTRLAYIMTQATDCTMERARELLAECDYSIKPALIMQVKGVSKEEALAELEKVGNINKII